MASEAFLRPEKDQTYVLYCMTQHQLEHTLFPLYGMEKQTCAGLRRSMDW